MSASGIEKDLADDCRLERISEIESLRVTVVGLREQLDIARKQLVRGPGHLSLHERFIDGKPDWRLERIIPETRITLGSFGVDRLKAEEAYRAALTDDEGGK